MARSPQDRQLEEEQRQARLPEEVERQYPRLSRLYGANFPRESLDSLYKKVYGDAQNRDALLTPESTAPLLGGYAEDQYDPKDANDLAEKVAKERNLPIQVDPSARYQSDIKHKDVGDAGKYVFGTVKPWDYGVFGSTNGTQKTVAIARQPENARLELGTTLHELEHVNDFVNHPEFHADDKAITPQMMAHLMEADHKEVAPTGFFKKYPDLEPGGIGNLLEDIAGFKGARLQNASESNRHSFIDDLPKDKRAEFLHDALEAVLQAKIHKDFQQVSRKGHHQDYDNFNVDYPYQKIREALKKQGFNFEE